MMKERIDILLVKNNLAKSREKAKELITSGLVSVDGTVIKKPSESFEETANIVVNGTLEKYVSRGGLKLEKAIESFSITLTDKICMDVGASTGGFTDCMLKNGAKKVYSVDVGHMQLDKSLREDDRVVCMEGTNIRYLTKEDVDDVIEFVSVDVSFISLTKILYAIKELMANEAQIVTLIKPQFEAGKSNIGKKGVVKDPKIHIEVINNIVEFATLSGFEILNVSYSPIKGPEGNIEYLLHMKKTDSIIQKDISIKDLVNEAHKKL